jgi:molybdopterin-guanine dinucleotide biosynthesis protein B
VISPSQWELAGKLMIDPAPTLDDVVQRLGPADLVLVKGFKRAGIPKIEVRRQATATCEPIAPNDPNVIAIAADHAIESATVPVFALDDIAGISDFVLNAAKLSRR